MYNHKRTRHSKRFQRGFSLMELMVGLTIGLLVVVAALGSFLYTQISSGVVGDSARLQQEADNTFRILGFQIQQAGAINLGQSTTDPDRVIFSSAFTGFDPTTTGATAGQIFSIHGLEGASNAPDTLRVSYQDGNGTTHDCLGNTLLTSNTWNNARRNIRMDNQFTVDTAKKELNCAGATAAGAQPIADGVEDFQVTYGVQTVAGGVLQYQFYTADLVPDWTNIQAVTVCLQFIGENRGNPQPGLVVTGCRGQTVTNDGLLRKVFRRTYSLRNALL
ncbi:PilW family protein [Polaromonas naphthalenivorans]|uniref:Tfp pilus assembly protein PilW-like protein n=1 Tax=Polaromonas naphthalenivorans (strain CJ2) TaxID=365044 RepID=A1VRD2_POLNA|nr:PilW family protein [Polaromonas naphthalenivorans]ABM38210.1 Tfp pilus assembly protein PilW-like protein [Polaromonas naphthalenivorans CJ2]